MIQGERDNVPPRSPARHSEPMPSTTSREPHDETGRVLSYTYGYWVSLDFRTQKESVDIPVGATIAHRVLRPQPHAAA